MSQADEPTSRQDPKSGAQIWICHKSDGSQLLRTAGISSHLSTYGMGMSCGDGQGVAEAFKELGLGAVSCSGFLHRALNMLAASSSLE